MDVSQSRLLDFLGREGVRFSIPAYQRLYSWSEAQCEELWLDIFRAARKGQSHFIGTIICEPIESDSPTLDLEIIDGQQRITSVSLVLLALSRLLDAHPGLDCGPFASASVLKGKYLLADAPTAQGYPMKLIPSRHDRNDYAAAIEGGAPASGPEPDSAIWANLGFFEQKMSAPDFDLQQLIKGMQLLTAIVVEVDGAEESQAIFESINSKGMSLNVADMIRNYLLLAEDRDEQTRLFEEYWKPSQEMFSPDPGSLKMNAGIKAWLSIRLKSVKVLSANQVYGSFKKYAEDIYRGDKEPILRELRGFCLMWAESYRYHGVKKYRSGSDWAELGAPSLTSGYELKRADNEEYAEQLREKLRTADSRW